MPTPDWLKRWRDKNREKYRKYQREFERKKYAKYKEQLKKLIGDKCFFCRNKSSKNHEVNFKKHSYSYEVEHYKDFCPLCTGCHLFLHRNNIKGWDNIIKIFEFLNELRTTTSE